MWVCSVGGGTEDDVKGTCGGARGEGPERVVWRQTMRAG